MIEKFFVKKLFGIFDNEIEFKQGGITVIIGQNGCGKTTMLQMLSAIFSKTHSELFKYEFEYIELSISGHVLKIELLNEYSQKKESQVKSLKYYLDSNPFPKCYKENIKMNSPFFWSKFIPSLRPRLGNQFYNIENDEVLTLSEVINLYYDDLPEEIRNQMIAIPNEVYNLISNFQIELITTERLKKIYNDEDFRRIGFVEKFMVEECSEELKNSLKNILSRYANTSQKLDEQFPSKILEAIKKQNNYSETELKENIQKINELRKKHVKAGVLEENNNKILDIDVDSENIDENMLVILTVYYQDMKLKLESLNDISDKIVLFKSIIANKFNLSKEISIDRDNGIIITQKPTNKKVSLKFLSSGEQQELVLLYNLIFKGDKGKLILIDEPEISLNVNWQREFLNDMKKIVNINDLSILVATHSPQIINDNWDLVETLGEFE